MGVIRKTKPKQANVEKLETFLKKIDNGKQKNNGLNTQGKSDSK